MQVEHVYSGGHPNMTGHGNLSIPPQMRLKARVDGVVKPIEIPPTQMQGTNAEQLVELAGRVCYDSLGKGRPSSEYHKHLLDVRHYSVHEHVHFTVEIRGLDALGYTLGPLFWAGIPDISLSMWREHNQLRTRLTANIRHCLEWPHNVTSEWRNGVSEEYLVNWDDVLKGIAHALMPSVIPPPKKDRSDWWEFVRPERDTEAHVSLFLEDSRVWSHEMVRHRCNISQRSARYTDETDRDFRLHPLLRDYLDELGYLSVGGSSGVSRGSDGTIHRETVAPDETPVGANRQGEPIASLFQGGNPDLSHQERNYRMRLFERVNNHTLTSQLLYAEVTQALQEYAQAKGLTGTDARKQARSAARYHLGNGTSTEMIFTASIRNWRKIFEQRCSPAADQAIRELMTLAREKVRATPWGHLL